MPEGLVYPPIDDLREASVEVATRVIEQAVKDGVAEATDLQPDDIERIVRSHFWRPGYLPFVRAPGSERRFGAWTEATPGPRKA